MEDLNGGRTPGGRGALGDESVESCVLCQKKVLSELSDDKVEDGGGVVFRKADLLPPDFGRMFGSFRPFLKGMGTNGYREEEEDKLCICEGCAGKVLDVGSLISAMKQQVRELKGIRNSVGVKDGEFENELMSSGVGEKVIRSTLQFLNCDLTTEVGTAENSTLPKLRIDDSIKLEPDDKPEQFVEDPLQNDDFMTPVDTNEDMEVSSSSEPEDNPATPSTDEDEEWAPSTKKPKSSLTTPPAPEDNPPDNPKRPRKARRLSTKSSPSFFCEVPNCGKTFTLACNLVKHHRTFHPSLDPLQSPELTPGSFQTCDMCGSHVPFSDLLSHAQSHVGNYALPCPFTPSCPFVACNPRSLRLHCKGRLKTCRAAYIAQDFSKNNVCETCNFKSPYLQALQAHLRQNHERAPEKNYSCPFPSCDATFCVRQSVWYHLEAHSKNIMTKQPCKLCSNKRFPVGVSMETHLKTWHSATEILKCEQCPFLYPDHVSLLDHLYIHRQAGMRCAICKDKHQGLYNNHNDLRKHYKNKHEMNLPTYLCEHCSAVFKMKSKLDYHVQKRHAPGAEDKEKVPEKRFPCELCHNAVEFSAKTGLIHHKISVHGQEPFTCKTCGKTFKAQKCFVRHLKTHQGLEYMYECKVPGCGMTYKSYNGLREHRVKTHDNDRVKTCEICQKGFASEMQLKRHREIVHLGIKPFVCEECGKGFSEMKKLKNHKTWHQGRVKKTPVPRGTGKKAMAKQRIEESF